MNAIPERRPLRTITAAGADALLEGVRHGGGTEALARAVWTALVEPGDSVAGELIAEHGAMDALRLAVADADDDLAEARERWLPRWTPDLPGMLLGAARRASVRLIVPGDAEWPGRRFADLGAHAPIALWARGGPLVDVGRAVAIVGARAATAYGQGVAADLAADLAPEVLVVSGAAYGIDGAAHRSALGAGGRTLAFLAGGVDRPYPRGHDGLLTRIAAAGAVWSEVPCGAAPTKWRFLSRNRLIAASADAVVVVEAGTRSGSLNTAAHAATLGRPLGAVPGPVTSATSAGCHRILREFGGVCVTSADDVRALIGVDGGAGGDPDTARIGDHTRVLDALSRRSGRATDDLARRSGLSPAEVSAILGWLSLQRLVERDDEGRWIRTP